MPVSKKRKLKVEKPKRQKKMTMEEFEAMLYGDIGRPKVEPGSLMDMSRFPLVLHDYSDEVANLWDNSDITVTSSLMTIEEYYELTEGGQDDEAKAVCD